MLVNRKLKWPVKVRWHSTQMYKLKPTMTVSQRKSEQRFFKRKKRQSKRLSNIVLIISLCSYLIFVCEVIVISVEANKNGVCQNKYNMGIFSIAKSYFLLNHDLNVFFIILPNSLVQTMALAFFSVSIWC